MTIVRNLHTNPSAEVSLAGWTALGGALARVPFDNMKGQQGAQVVQCTADASATRMFVRTLSIPATAGLWVAPRVWVASDGLWVTLQVFAKAANGTVLTSTTSGYDQTTGWYEGDVLRTPALNLPAGTTHLDIEVVARNAADTPVTGRLWVDGWNVAAAATEDAARLGQAAGYLAGDTPGWAWDGTPHASASRGPTLPYSHDGELRDTAGKRLAWLDLIAGYEATSESRMAVQTSLGTFPKQFARGGNAGPRVGTLRIHFTRELADGTPAGRSLAVEQLLRQGVARQLVVNMDPGVGPTDFTFYPTGRIVRRLEHATAGRGPAARAVWTVECEFTELLP